MSPLPIYGVSAPTGTLRVAYSGKILYKENFIGGQWISELTGEVTREDRKYYYWVQEESKFIDDLEFFARFTKLGGILYG